MHSINHSSKKKKREFQSLYCLKAFETIFLIATSKSSTSQSKKFRNINPYPFCAVWGFRGKQNLLCTSVSCKRRIQYYAAAQQEELPIESEGFCPWLTLKECLCVTWGGTELLTNTSQTQWKIGNCSPEQRGCRRWLDFSPGRMGEFGLLKTGPPRCV